MNMLCAICTMRSLTFPRHIQNWKRLWFESEMLIIAQRQNLQRVGENSRTLEKGSHDSTRNAKSTRERT